MDLISFKQINLLHNIYNPRVHRQAYLSLHHYWHHIMPMDFMVIKTFFLFFLKSTSSSRMYIIFIFFFIFLSLSFSFGFSFCSLMHACYPLLPPCSWWAISSSMSVFILSCIIIWLQCKALFKFLFFNHKNINWFFFVALCLSSNLSLPSSYFFCIQIFFFFFFRHSFVFLCLWHTAFERKTILSHIIFYLFVAFGLSISLFHSQTFLSAACARSLLFVSDLDFCMCWPCFLWARVFVCLVSFFYISFFFCSACSFFFQDK